MTTHLNHAINTFLIRTPFHGPTVTATVSTDAPISPSFWQRQPTNLMAKIVQLQRCLTKRRPKKFPKMSIPQLLKLTDLKILNFSFSFHIFHFPHPFSTLLSRHIGKTTNSYEEKLVIIFHSKREYLLNHPSLQ